MCTGASYLNEAHAAGFDYVEFSAWDLLFDQSDEAFKSVQEKVLASPIPVEACNCFVPGNIKVTGQEVIIEAVRRHMDIVLRRASEIGISVMVFGSGGARRAPDGFPLERARVQYSEAVRLAAEIGARYGVTIALEPLSSKECNIFNLVSEGCKIIDGVNHPNAKVLADLYHMEQMHEPMSDIVAAGSRLAHVHIDLPQDFPVLAGQDKVSYLAFIDALEQNGYDGRVSIESHTYRPANEQPIGEYYKEAREVIAAIMPVSIK